MEDEEFSEERQIMAYASVRSKYHSMAVPKEFRGKYLPIEFVTASCLEHYLADYDSLKHERAVLFAISKNVSGLGRTDSSKIVKLFEKEIAEIFNCGIDCGRHTFCYQPTPGFSSWKHCDLDAAIKYFTSQAKKDMGISELH